MLNPHWVMMTALCGRPVNNGVNENMTHAHIILWVEGPRTSGFNTSWLSLDMSSDSQFMTVGQLFAVVRPGLSQRDLFTQGILWEIPVGDM